jgi:hypothetical protein
MLLFQGGVGVLMNRGALRRRLQCAGITPKVQAIFFRRRHQPGKPPLADHVGKEVHPSRL